MNCLVCHEVIEIRGFRDLFSVSEPTLCHRCRPFLQKGSGSAVFLENPWLRDVVARLDKGDLALLEVLRPAMDNYRSGLLKNGAVVAHPHSWLQMLVPSQSGPLTISVNSPETDFQIF